MGLKTVVLRCLKENGGKMKVRKLVKIVHEEKEVDEVDHDMIQKIIEKLKKKKEIISDGKYLVIEGNTQEKAEDRGEVEQMQAATSEPTLSTSTSTSTSTPSSNALERYKEASQNILNKQQGICTHGKKRVKCRKCRDEVGGIESDDVYFCVHGKRRDRCKEKGCGGKAFCVHGKIDNLNILLKYPTLIIMIKRLIGRRKIDCRQCGGSRICTHGRVKRFCKDCGGNGLCVHQKRVYLCRMCKKEKKKSIKQNVS